MSEHWYTRDGSAAYETNGRATTLRDARKVGLVPSVTTVLGVIEKPALITWMVKQGIEAVRNGAQLDGEADDTYIARMLADSKAKSIAAAEEGSRIHDACERYVRDGYLHEDELHKYYLAATAARDELARIFPGVTDWVAEKSFAHPLGFGGKCDLHSPSTGIIVDYKTKDGDFSDGKKLAWDQHWQLAAYQVGLGLRNITHNDDNIENLVFAAPGAAIFISRTHPGCVSSYVWSADEMAQGWQVFAAALALHKLLRNYDGSF